MTKKQKQLHEEMKHLQAVQDAYMFRLHERALQLAEKLRRAGDHEEISEASAQLHDILVALHGKHFAYNHAICTQYGWTCTLDLLED